VPPPKACLATPDATEFDRLGFRVPFYVISPWARPGYVSHETHEHASMLRLIELLHGLPAMTGRDANADALLDLFDFEAPALLHPPTPPDAAPVDSCE
jgi:phospholipase C